jgi:hypothetical protein
MPRDKRRVRYDHSRPQARPSRAPDTPAVSPSHSRSRANGQDRRTEELAERVKALEERPSQREA